MTIYAVKYIQTMRNKKVYKLAQELGGNVAERVKNTAKEAGVI